MSTETFKKLDIPANDLEVVMLTPEQKAMFEKITKRATDSGEWEHAQDFRMDYNDLEFGAYYLNKSIRPILRPLQGHDELETVFAGFRKSRFELNGGASAEPVWLSAAGDLMCTKELERSQDVLYEEVAPFLFDADICFANLESTFADGEIKPMVISSAEGPKINLDLPQYRALTDYRGRKYDLVQLANNHIIDCGREGIRRTLAHLQEDGIRQAGVNTDEESAHRAVILEKAGLKIGWIAHTTLLNNRSLPEDAPWLVNLTYFDPFTDADLSRIKEQIHFCREENCDLIIVAMHWGLEYEFYPHPREREWAQAFADEGADIIIGQHPHVIQYSEVIHPADDPAKDVPVVYSQGNLTSVLSCAASCLTTLARFRIEPGKDHARVTGLELLPVALTRCITGDESHVEIKKLTTLLSLKPELDEEMQRHIEDMAACADMVLGSDWRE
ncbi:MAG: CapA family protein [Clostridia bacterium]|nr:CapA family protein [Clostridia bacterium]